MTSTSGWRPSSERNGFMNARMTITAPTATQPRPMPATTKTLAGAGRKLRVSRSISVWLIPPGSSSRVAWRRA